MRNRSIRLIGIGILSGAMIGTVLGQILTFLLPDGSTVKQFFLTSFDFSFGSIGLLFFVIIIYTIFSVFKISINDTMRINLK